VRVLLDECVPRQLKDMLSSLHEVATVFDVGWAGLKNGVLLSKADPLFDTLVTADQQMYYQQSFVGFRISVIVLPTNQLRLARSTVPALIQSLGRIEAGQRVLMDLAADVDRWPELRLQRVVDEGTVTRHIFGREA
jgi:hypothetical protein